MKLQKNTSLALYSVLESAADPTRHVAAAEIAAKYGVSPHHLAKVLSELARAGILASVRGVGGGYRFAANPRRLTLLDVILQFEELGPQGSGEEQGERTAAGRALHTVLSEIDDITQATFSTVTISTMLQLIERQQHAATKNGAVHSDHEPTRPERARKRRS